MAATIDAQEDENHAGAHAAARQRRFARTGALAGGAMFRDALRGMAFRANPSPALRERASRACWPATEHSGDERNGRASGRRSALANAREASSRLDLPVAAAPDVVPVDLGFRLDVAVVETTWRFRT